MSVKVYKNIFALDEVKELNNYFYTDDQYTHVIENQLYNRTKNLQWNDQWPRLIVKSKLDNLLLPYEAEILFFHQTSTHFGIHVDTGSGHNLLYKNVLIPLNFEGPAQTIFFKNFVNAPSVPSMRFTKQFVVDNNVSNNYNLIENYDSKKLFDQELYTKYFKFTPIEDLHGLTIDMIYEWNVGDLVTWDRKQLHCSGQLHQKKSWISIFLNYKRLEP